MAQLAASPATRPLPVGRRRIGVLALQGAVREHMNALAEIGAEPIAVRLPADLDGLDGLILPGGESTTMRSLIDEYGLREPIRLLAEGGAALLGTCAGMILLAKRIEDGEAPVLGLLDVTVRRNAYGRQLESHEADVLMPAIGDEPLRGIFIRAPVVSEVGPEVEVLARDDEGQAIAVRQGRILATAFHPELTPDRRLHRLLLAAVEA